MTTTNMPTPGGVCREIPLLVGPVIRPLSVPTGFPTVKDRSARPDRKVPSFAASSLECDQPTHEYFDRLETR
jgi:hypothetical protein